MARPTQYLPEYCELLLKHMEEGFSFEAFAGRVGVARRTLYKWVKAHPEFKASKEIATMKGLFYWERAIIDVVKGKVRSTSAAVLIFLMKNRFGWRDKTPEEEQQNKATLPPSNITNAQILELIREAAEQKHERTNDARPS